MSKIGKKNIVLPKDSSIKIDGANLTITGPKGSKTLSINDKIFSSRLDDSKFKIEPVNANKMILSTESNYVTFFNIGEIKSVIRISRGDQGNQSDTRP